MAIRYNALYSDLLEDLSDYLPKDIVDEKSSAAFKGWWPDMTLAQFRSIQLTKTFFKKLEDRSSKKADDAALEKFLQSNLRCRDWSLRLESLEDELLVGSFKNEIYRFLNPGGHSICSSFPAILDGGRTGPGSSIAARGTDFYTKLFSSPLSMTSKGLQLVYESYFEHYPDWLSAERHRSSHFSESVVTEGNRLSFVPKNGDISRTICTEPSLNMFFQLGLSALIEKRLKSYFGIDLSNQQEVNRDLARIGSKDDSLCTIDLSSASDTVSLSMVEAMVPRDFVVWLRHLRSPKCQLPSGSWETLYMLSSMGNGFTFSFQTAIFACVVSAAYQVDSHPLHRNRSKKVNGLLTLEHGNFGVFGDDIIVEKRVYRKVTRLLSLLGFEVNAEKSFSEGPFRESCGADFFRGQWTRGIYIKSLKSQASRYVAINRLNEWSAITGIPLRRVIRSLHRQVRKIYVPVYENDDAGIKVPLDIAMQLGCRLSHVNYGSIVYRKWEVLPRTLRITEGAIRGPRSSKVRIYNPDGLFLAILRGDIRSHESGKPDTMGSRLGPARYRTKEAVTPNWDYLPTIGKQFPVGFSRLASATLINLCL